MDADATATQRKGLRSKRRVQWLRVARHLLVGAVTTILLALACARFLWAERDTGRLVWSSMQPARAWPGPAPESWPDSPSSHIEQWVPSGNLLRSLRIGFGFARYSCLGYKRPWEFTYKAVAFGLPFPALRADECTAFTTSSAVQMGFGYHNAARVPWRGIAVPKRAPFNLFGDPQFVVPILPYWPGFVLNTLFWAWISMLFHRLFRARRIVRRLSKAQCPQCRYPIGTTPICSECGMQIPGGLCKPHADHTPAES